jgi:restriction endonuclease-like protein
MRQGLGHRMPLEAVLSEQARWATNRWPSHSGKRAPSLEANLITPMSDEIRNQFSSGSGGELGQPTRPGKMNSLRSSSALAYNFFAPWVGQSLLPLAAALGQRVTDASLRFERQFPHGLSSTPPNIDVTLDNDQSRPLAIECKFTEPFGAAKHSEPLHSKYFVGKRHRWTEAGLPKCQTLAESIGKTVHFRRLGAGQLLKHFLGIALTTGRPPRLVCLWFDSACQESLEHRSEIDQFGGHLDDKIDFSAVTYQEVFANLRGQLEPIPGYVQYLAGRYFAA